MRAVIQRVSHAEVVVEGKVTGSIAEGLLLFLGIEKTDEQADIDWLVGKAVNLRIFEDTDGKMNQSILDTTREVLLISQFTLYGNVRKGTRPSFNRAASPEVAIPLYENFAKALEVELGKTVPRGVFGAHMDIAAQNHGPVTIVLDSRLRDF